MRIRWFIYSILSFFLAGPVVARIVRLLRLVPGLLLFLRLLILHHRRAEAIS